MVLDGFIVTSSNNEKKKSNQKVIISKCQSVSELSSQVPCAMLIHHIISLICHHKPSCELGTGLLPILLVKRLKVN